MDKRVTQNEVAHLAGVSRFTVSVVVNNRDGGNIRISDETRQRVLRVIEQTGYRPNFLARGLRTHRTQLLAVMVQDLTNPFYPLFIRGAQKVAQEYGYQLLVFDAFYSAENEHSFIESMLNGWVDGVILRAFHSDEREIRSLLEAGLSVVDLGSRIGTIDVSTVSSRGGDAVLAMMRHLLERGHRCIAHLAGPQDTPPGKIRMEAYCQALLEAGIPFDETLVRFGNFTAQGIAHLIASLFPSSKPKNHPTALFAANDVMAIEALKTLIQFGWKVPEEVAVVGFDNIPEASVVSPALTTIDPNATQQGCDAAKIIIDQLQHQGHQQPVHIEVPCNIIFRLSG